jgi:hypothetical protein
MGKQVELGHFRIERKGLSREIEAAEPSICYLQLNAIFRAPLTSEKYRTLQSKDLPKDLHGAGKCWHMQGAACCYLGTK